MTRGIKASLLADVLRLGLEEQKNLSILLRYEIMRKEEAKDHEHRHS